MLYQRAIRLFVRVRVKRLCMKILMNSKIVFVFQRAVCGETSQCSSLYLKSIRISVRFKELKRLSAARQLSAQLNSKVPMHAVMQIFSRKINILNFRVSFSVAQELLHD